MSEHRESERAYFERRMREEREHAECAKDISARRAHRILAMAYEEKLAALDSRARPPAPDQPGAPPPA